MILYGRFGNHLPLHRQSESFAREGIDLDVSTLADWVGACAATLAPLVDLIRSHVLGAARIHGDDTTVPVLAKMKTRTGRLWTYVRDDRPFGGPSPPAAIFYYSSDREGVHPNRHLASYAGILQADAGACPRADLGPTRGADTTTSTKQTEDRGRSPRPRAGAMGVASSSNSPISPRPLTRGHRRSTLPGRRWHMRPYAGSI
jgi:hypothetical protein